MSDPDPKGGMTSGVASGRVAIGARRPFGDPRHTSRRERLLSPPGSEIGQVEDGDPVSAMGRAIDTAIAAPGGTVAGCFRNRGSLKDRPFAPRSVNRRAGFVVRGLDKPLVSMLRMRRSDLAQAHKDREHKDRE